MMNAATELFRPHITNVMENVADFLQFRLAVSAIGNVSIPPGQKFRASSKSVHRLGNRWDIKCLCDDIHRFLYYVCAHRQT